MRPRLLHLALVGCATVALAACQTAPLPDAGYLASYEGLTAREGTLRVSVRDRRDDARAALIDAVFVEPARILSGAAEGVSDTDVALVLGEVDRQVCYELSERFTVRATPGQDIATVRLAITRLRPTEPVSSGALRTGGRLRPSPGQEPPMSSVRTIRPCHG